MKNLRNIILSFLVVAAVLVGFAAYRGYIPPKSGVEGTIGAAKRYTSQQITSGDVALRAAEVQAVLQSDLVNKIQTNAEFRELVVKGDFSKALAKTDTRNTMQSEEFQKAVGKQEFKNVVANEDFKNLVGQQDF